MDTMDLISDLDIPGTAEELEIIKVHRRLRTGQVQKVIVLELRLRQIRFAGATMDFRQGSEHIFQHIEERPEQGTILWRILDAVLGQTLQGLRRIRTHLAHVGPEETPPDHEQYLILVADMAVGQRLRQQFVHHDPKGVHIGLKGVRVQFLHPYHLRGHPQNAASRLVGLFLARPPRLRSGQTEISDLHRQILVQEDVVRLEVSVGWEIRIGLDSPDSLFEASPVDDILGVQIVHALGHLPANVDQCVQLELRLADMDVLIEATALAPLGDNGQGGLGDAAHEEQDVAVARLLQHGHLVLEGLQLGWARGLHVERLHGYGSVPVGAVDRPERSRPDARPNKDLLGLDVLRNGMWIQVVQREGFARKIPRIIYSPSSPRSSWCPGGVDSCYSRRRNGPGDDYASECWWARPGSSWNDPCRGAA